MQVTFLKRKRRINKVLIYSQICIFFKHFNYAWTPCSLEDRPEITRFHQEHLSGNSAWGGLTKSLIPGNSVILPHQVLSVFFINRNRLHFTSALIGNRVWITNCRATVSNIHVLPIMPTVRSTADGKGGRTVTSQETCLFRTASPGQLWQCFRDQRQQVSIDRYTSHLRWMALSFPIVTNHRFFSRQYWIVQNESSWRWPWRSWLYIMFLNWYEKNHSTPSPYPDLTDLYLCI